jgi:hypothetical protein
MRIYRYCGRDFTAEEIETIRAIVARDPGNSRTRISRLVCEALKWYKPDGGLKDMSCRVAMLRMRESGLISLPPSRGLNGNPEMRIRFTEETAEKPPLTTPAGHWSDLRFDLVSEKRQSSLWNEYMHRYHYLGYKRLPGAQLRYMVGNGDDLPALLGFSAAAWKTAPRDRFIGWNDRQRQSKLNLIVNNSRFLVLPWVRSKNLASMILGAIAKRLPADWRSKYNLQPVLLETFVESGKFKGTCYKAANWIFVGQTKGRGKLGDHKTSIPKKDIWLYPLGRNFKQVLLSK